MRECVQCAAETAVGKRCKNRTCIYTEFCATHTKKLMDLELKPSAIAGAGRGLYTMVDIPKDTRISQYTGEMKTDKEYAKKESGYGVYLPGGKVLDAHSTQHGIARYANDCRTANKNKGECKGANARLTSNTRDGKTTVWLKSTKKIMAGHEIFISYGRGYWSGAPTRSHPPEEGKYDDWTVKSGNKHQPRVDGVVRLDLLEKPPKKKKKKNKKNVFKGMSDTDALKEIEALEQARTLGRSIYSIKDRGGLAAAATAPLAASVNAPAGSVFATAAQNLGLRLD
jgi:hypothetical protein